MRRTSLPTLACCAYALTFMSGADTETVLDKSENVIAVYPFMEGTHSETEQGFFTTFRNGEDEFLVTFDINQIRIKVNTGFGTAREQQKLEKRKGARIRKQEQHMNTNSAQDNDYAAPLSAPESRDGALNNEDHSVANLVNASNENHASSSSNFNYQASDTATENTDYIFKDLEDIMPIGDLDHFKTRLLVTRNNATTDHPGHYSGSSLTSEKDSPSSKNRVLAEGEHISNTYRTTGEHARSSQEKVFSTSSALDHSFDNITSAKHSQRSLAASSRKRTISPCSFTFGEVPIQDELIKFGADVKVFDVILKSKQKVKAAGVVGLRYPFLKSRHGIPLWLEDASSIPQRKGYACLQFVWNATNIAGLIIVKFSDLKVDGNIFRTKPTEKFLLYSERTLAYLLEVDVFISQHYFKTKYIQFNTTTSWITLPSSIYQKFTNLLFTHHIRTDAAVLTVYKKLPDIQVNLSKGKHFVITGEMYTDTNEDECFLRIREGKFPNVIVLGTTLMKKLQPTFWYHPSKPAVLQLEKTSDTEVR